MNIEFGSVSYSHEIVYIDEIGAKHESPYGWRPYMGAGQSIFEEHKNALPLRNCARGILTPSFFKILDLIY
jgi:hypothetical protein